MEAKTKGHGNGHAWIAGITGLAISIILLIKMPEYKLLTGTVLVLALAHLLAGILFLGSAWLIIPRGWIQRRLAKKNEGRLYFGWSYGWMNLFWVYFAIALLAAWLVYLIHPGLMWLSFLLLLLSFQFFAGYVNIRRSKKNEYLTLPFVDMGTNARSLVLDAGCGGGRTTIALGRALKNVNIAALDRFDSNYIQDGGRGILEKNLAIAGMTERTQVAKGDITALQFPENHFDAAISSYMMDHLGNYKLAALHEINRVLKPGGRFLLIVFVPNWFTFSIFNVLCNVLTSHKGWYALFEKAGLQLNEEGALNGGVYFLLQKNG
jgi:hypothetical protein